MDLQMMPKDQAGTKTRTLLLWATVCLLSISWYPLTGIYLPTNIHYVSPIWFSFIAFGFAVICSAVASVTLRLEPSNRSSFLILLSSLLFSFIIPFPYNAAAFFLAAGAIVKLIQSRLKLERLARLSDAFSGSLFLCGLILAVQTAVLPFFSLFASRFHKVEALAPVLSFLFNIVGSRASYSSGDLFVQSADKVYSFIPSWEGLGLYLVLNVLIGSYVVLYLLSAPKKRYALLPIILFAYMILRYFGVVFAFIELEKANVFWRLDLLVVTLLPLPWVLTKFLPLNQSTLRQEVNFALRDKEHLGYVISLTIFMISCVGFFGFVDPGEKKQGRILIDEKHSDWEWTTKEFNTTWYGEKSAYNYWSLAQYLNYFYKVDKRSEVLTDQLLSQYDILFIKTPTEPFSESEIASIKKFVERGGGLLLVGDHTNVFGITTNLNPLASQFGVRFRYDGQYDLSGELSLYEKPVVLPHPVVQEMPKFMFATGCMLDAPLMAENAIIGYGVKLVYLDYSRPNFFPKDAVNTERMEFGLFVQAAGIPFGKGRVFLFTDSTVWSNFYMFIPGKPELLLVIIEWLNRRNSFLVILRSIFLLLGGITFIASILFAKRIGKTNLIGLSVVLGLVVLPLAITAFEKMNRYFYAVPQPHTKYVKVAFESEHSDIELPVLHTTRRREQSYHTFYVWLQRLGFVPRLAPSYTEAVSGADVLVIINPVKSFTEEEVQLTKEFFDGGGKILLMDDPTRTNHSVVNEFLSQLGLAIRMRSSSPSPITIVRKGVDTLKVLSSLAGEIRGGEPLLLAKGRFACPEEFGA